jgi:hypothetical protein
MMEEVRLIRNKLVHFRGELTANERHTLRFCSDWFKAHQNITDDFDNDTKVVPIEGSTTTSINQSPSSKLPYKGEVEKALDIKYSALIQYFKTLEGQGHTSVQMYFGDIEPLVKGKLPQAAREHTTWWTDESSHTQPWLEAGWRAKTVYLNTATPLAQFTFWPSIPHLIKEPYQYIYWMNKLKVNEAELLEAISKVGEESDMVEIHINSKRERQEEVESKSA